MLVAFMNSFVKLASSNKKENNPTGLIASFQKKNVEKPGQYKSVKKSRLQKIIQLNGFSS